MVLVRGDAGWDQSGSNEDREKWAKRGQNPRRECGQGPYKGSELGRPRLHRPQEGSDLLKPYQLCNSPSDREKILQGTSACEQSPLWVPDVVPPGLHATGPVFLKLLAMKDTRLGQIPPKS